MSKPSPHATLLARVVDQLKLPVLVFAGGRQVYSNSAGDELSERLRRDDRIDLRVVILSHLAALEEAEPESRPAPTVTLLTSPSGEPFYLHVMPMPRRRLPTYAVSVRSSGADVFAFRRRYRLSAREGQITELVLRGWGNREIAQSLGITLTTAKKHLGRIFDKVGVDSRSQLMARLG